MKLSKQKVPYQVAKSKAETYPTIGKYISYIKWKMEMGNVSKRQQPDHRTDNSRRSQIGLQCSENSRTYVYLKYTLQDDLNIACFSIV